MPTATQKFERSSRAPAIVDEKWDDECEVALDKWSWRVGGNVYERECYVDERAIPKVRPAPALEPWETLPFALKQIKEAITQSRGMLVLPDDWDEDGAKQIGEDTWRRAVSFLTRYAERVWDGSGRVLDAPDITPSVDGSVDIHWDRLGYELLIAIPPDGGAMASFYGDNRGRGFIKGEFDMNDLNEGLIEWLMKA